MKKRVRNCIVCGKEYEYCNNCSSHVSFPAWMAIYHSDNCRQIMNIATEYMAGNLNKSDAKAMFENCDLTDKKKFKESIIKVINEVCTEKKSVKIESLKVEKQTAEEI